MYSKIFFFLFVIHIASKIGINSTTEHSNVQQNDASFCKPSKMPPYQNKVKEMPYNLTAFIEGLLEAWSFGKLKNYILRNHPDGLLEEKKEPLTKLDSNNFNENVYSNSSLAWVVFFNSKNYHNESYTMDSKLWKNLANSVYNWRKILALGEVNCDERSNKQLCLKYNVLNMRKVYYFVPFIDTFNPSKMETFVVHPMTTILSPNTKNDLALWRSLIIQNLDKFTPEHKKPSHWPELAPVTSGKTFESILVSNKISYDPEIWLSNLFKCLLTREEHLSVSDFSPDTYILMNHIDSTLKSKNSQLLILIIEKENSYVGRELILDLYGAPVTVRRTFRTELINTRTTEELPQVLVITSDDTREQVPLWINNRSGIYLILRSFLRNKGYLLMGNNVECGKYLSLEDLEEIAKKAKTHPITVDQMEIMHCMQERMIHAIADAFISNRGYR